MVQGAGCVLQGTRCMVRVAGCSFSPPLALSPSFFRLLSSVFRLLYIFTTVFWHFCFTKIMHFLYGSQDIMMI
jgi:hypothetical protein